MNVQIGDLVVLPDGTKAKVETHWAQGKHRVFKLDTGALVFDLDKLVAEGKAKVEKVKPNQKGRKWDWLPVDGEHDLEE